jgi:glycosyltransferase involved in cell wall biosynthesis
MSATASRPGTFPWLVIAIPTMRRWEFLKESLPIFLDQPQVAHVFITDETGEDAAQIAKSPFTQNPKLTVVVNEKRLGIYENKLKVLKLASESEKGEFVALLDSDNYFTEEWFDTLAAAVKVDQPKWIYASADFKMVNYMDNSVKQPCEKFSGLRLDKKGWNEMLRTPGWNFLLNDGNWVLPCSAWKVLPAQVKSSQVEAADAIFMLKMWIAAGYTVWYVPELSYIHTVHTGSSWLASERESTRILNTTNWLV